MMISTKGRYILRMMIDLSENEGEGYIPMKDIAKRQNISLKYLERLIPPLVKADYIEGIHGKGGGYRLTKEPSSYRVGDILRLAEGEIKPVACLLENAEECPMAESCRTRNMWQGLSTLVNDYFDSITLSDLMKK